jgi:hypothetical protein
LCPSVSGLVDLWQQVQQQNLGESSALQSQLQWLVGHTLQQMHAAQLASVNNNNPQALQLLDGLCVADSLETPANSCNQSVSCNVCSACCQDYIFTQKGCDLCFQERCKPRPTIPEAVWQSQKTVCTLIDNLRNGIDLFGYSQHQVAPLVGSEYASVVHDVVTTMKDVEQDMQTFENKQTAYKVQVTTLQTTLNSIGTDQEYWTGKQVRSKGYVDGLEASL